MTNTYSIYSDGNYFHRAKKSGFGGYIESPEGENLVEFTEQIKNPAYLYNFELLGIIRGLQLAVSMNLKHVKSYSDDKASMLRINRILKNELSIEQLPANAKPELFKEIYELSKHFKSIQFQYIPREQNKHSDFLSRNYANLIKKNFLRKFTQELDFAENCFANNIHSRKKIYFSHPHMIKIKEKNNPFLVAPIRNKKVRTVIKNEKNTPYQYLFIELIPTVPQSVVVYHYNQQEKTKILEKTIEDELPIHDLIKVMKQGISSIIKKENPTNNIWIYSNTSLLNDYLEQKKKIHPSLFKEFSQLFFQLNDCKHILFHQLPFKHEFSPEIQDLEKKKEHLRQNIDDIDQLIDLLQTNLLEKEYKKCFGKLISLKLKEYKNTISRELNDMEKQKIIENTTQLIGIKKVSI